MRVYRIVSATHARTAFSGDGALFTEGRWHSRGRRVVYTSASEAAARLEILAHWAAPDLLPAQVRITADLPDDVSSDSIDTRLLPAGWDRPPPYLRTVQRLGDRWLAHGTSLVLRVPSALSPSDRHLLINPLHSEMALLRITATDPCSFDTRLV